MKTKFKHLVSVLTVCFCLFFINEAFSVCIYCVGSSNASLNTGHCRLGSFGDACYNDGSGPACEKNGSHKGECLNQD